MLDKQCATCNLERTLAACTAVSFVSVLHLKVESNIATFLVWDPACRRGTRILGELPIERGARSKVVGRATWVACCRQRAAGAGKVGGAAVRAGRAVDPAVGTGERGRQVSEAVGVRRPVPCVTAVAGNVVGRLFLEADAEADAERDDGQHQHGLHGAAAHIRTAGLPLQTVTACSIRP